MTVRPRVDRRCAIALLGSGEFEPWTDAIDRDLVDRCAGDGRVAILPTASAPDGDAVFDRWARAGLAHFRRIGVPATVVQVKTRPDAFAPANVEALSGASLVYVSGGTPSYLASTLAATPLWRAILRALDDGAGYAGSSAGACVLGEMAPDSVTEKLYAPDWAPGLGLLPGIVVCPHWDALDDHEPGMRAFDEAQIPDDCSLVAIDEATAMVGDGFTWRAHGAGRVHAGRRGAWRRFVAGARFSLAPDEDLQPIG
jgi:cyanophycinase-like exopeptidase